MTLRNRKADFETGTEAYNASSAASRPDALRLEGLAFSPGPAAVGSSDPSPLYRSWRARVDNAQGKVFISSGTLGAGDWLAEVELFSFDPAQPLTEPTLAFGWDGRPVVAGMRGGKIELTRWTGSAYETRGFAGRTPVLLLDDPVDSTEADVICFYLDASNVLRYRDQRADYATEKNGEQTLTANDYLEVGIHDVARRIHLAYSTRDVTAGTYTVSWFTSGSFPVTPPVGSQFIVLASQDESQLTIYDYNGYPWPGASGPPVFNKTINHQGVSGKPLMRAMDCLPFAQGGTNYLLICGQFAIELWNLDNLISTQDQNDPSVLVWSVELGASGTGYYKMLVNRETGRLVVANDVGGSFEVYLWRLIMDFDNPTTAPSGLLNVQVFPFLHAANFNLCWHPNGSDVVLYGAGRSQPPTPWTYHGYVYDTDLTQIGAYTTSGVGAPTNNYYTGLRPVGPNRVAATDATSCIIWEITIPAAWSVAATFTTGSVGTAINPRSACRPTAGRYTYFHTATDDVIGIVDNAFEPPVWVKKTGNVSGQGNVDNNRSDRMSCTHDGLFLISNGGSITSQTNWRIWSLADPLNPAQVDSLTLGGLNPETVGGQSEFMQLEPQVFV